MRHHLDTATCVAPPQYLLLNSWKSKALRALDCVALVVVGGSMQTATLLENSSFATLTTMSMKSCVFCAAWKLPLLCVSWALNIFTMSRQDSLSFNSMHCLVFCCCFENESDILFHLYINYQLTLHYHVTLCLHNIKVASNQPHKLSSQTPKLPSYPPPHKTHQ